MTKMDDVLAAVVYLLEQGIDWPSGHAARAIGNFAASHEACTRMHAMVRFPCMLLDLTVCIHMYTYVCICVHVLDQRVKWPPGQAVATLLLHMRYAFGCIS
jgi:hypothetical protein